LKTLGPEDLDLIRYSAVTSLSFKGDFVAFKLAVRGITKGFSMPKKNILEEAVRITMQEEKTIARSDFNTILTKIRQIDLHQPENRVLKDLLAGKHLGLWKNIFERKKVDEEIDDDVDIHRAFLKLVELNKSIEGLKCFVESSYKDVKETFAYLNTEINSRQLATAMAMAANTEYNKY
jgi:hypothetical protein